VGSNLDTPRIFRILYSVWGGTPHFGSGMKTASAALFWHLPVPGDCALAHASGVVAALAQTFRPRRACDRRMDPQRSHACCLRAASQWRLSIVCIPSKVVSKVLRSSAVVRALPVPVDRLCLRLSSASGCAHRKNGDLRTFYALAASSSRHAT